MKVAIFRRGHFNAAHCLSNPNWSEEKNREVFGPCANPNFHGHNYEVEVKVVGEIDQETGFVINLKYLRDIIEEEIENWLDHKNLNLDIPEFADLLPSTENICYLIWGKMNKRLGKDYDITITLWETPRNYAQYPV